MSEPESNGAPPSTLPAARVDRPGGFRLPLVWLIPLVSALIGVFLAVKSYYDQGPTITLSFKTGDGLEAGKTRIKYKDVDVGQILSVALDESGDGVTAKARMAPEAARLLVDDTRFWVVKAQVSGGQVSGLQTLLSGAYVGMDVGKSVEERRNFIGLDAPPAVTLDIPGTYYTLRANSLGSINVGTPLYYRRIEAGQVTGFNLDEEGGRVEMQIFVKAPYDKFVNLDTRFWHASGVDVKLSADGVQVRTESITSLLSGGIAFQSRRDSQADTAPPNHVFRLYDTREVAMKQRATRIKTYMLQFSESVRGLTVGAPVDFRGLTIGEVIGIEVRIDPVTTELKLMVEIDVYPDRMSSETPTKRKPMSEAEDRNMLERMVERGLRAQLRVGNLVSGQLYVALEYFPGVKPAKVVWDHDPPMIPTTKASFEELSATLNRFVAKLDRLPIDTVAKDVQATVKELRTAIASADTLLRRVDGLVDGPVNGAVKDLQGTLTDSRATMVEAREAVQEGRRLLAADSPLQQDLRNTLQELNRAAQALRQLADTLERQPESVLRGKREEQP